MSFAHQTAPSEPRPGFDRISVRRLVLIRWVAIAGQAVTLLVVYEGFGFAVPLVPAFAVVFCSVLLNLAIALYWRAQARLSERQTAVFLGYDLLQLGALLYLTGGLGNPFSILILAPVTVAATALSLRPVIALAALAIAMISLLALWHMPLPWQRPLHFPPEFVLGLWTALVIATIFISLYTWSVAAEARRLRDAVAATQLALAREQRVSAVGALAAAAAHELGSPLATIAVVAKELVHDLPSDSPHREDAELLLSQSERCRDILAQLAQRPDDEGGASPYTRLPISALVEASGAPYRDPRVRAIFAATGAPAADEPLVRRSPEIIHGLANLIQNAVQFAREEVSVTTHWDRTTVTVEIVDDGPGFPPNLLARLGEPYLSTRAGDSNHMGLGIFIAQSLLERSGAELVFNNLIEGGAHVVISWKRSNLETGTRPDAALPNVAPVRAHHT